MTAYIDKEGAECGISFPLVSFRFFWHGDMLEILPGVRLAYGYIEGIFEGEIVFQAYWLKHMIQIVFYTK